MENAVNGVPGALAELKEYLHRSAASPKGVDPVHAVEMLKQCESIESFPWSSEDRGEFLRCCVDILSLL